LHGSKDPLCFLIDFCMVGLKEVQCRIHAIDTNDGPGQYVNSALCKDEDIACHKSEFVRLSASGFLSICIFAVPPVTLNDSSRERSS
jgi:hypothetical protein